MLLDSVLNLKSEAFGQVFRYIDNISTLADSQYPIFVPPPRRSGRSESGRATETRRDERELIAIGVVPPSGNRKPDGFELAVFVQRKKLSQHPIIEALYRQSHGEMKLFKTGPAVKFSAKNGAKCRPLRIGASAGHYRTTAGSIGCFIKCRQNGGIGILSNNHILAYTNRAEVGDIILQPSRSDGGDRKAVDDGVARLYRFVPIEFGSAVNYVDCAFAALATGVRYDPSIVGPTGAALTLGEIETLIAGDEKVFKIGRTTGSTEGRVVAIGVDNLTISMVNGDPSKRARFDNQIAVASEAAPFSKPGDSGSLIMTLDGRPIALLFAGTQSGGSGGHGITYGNRLDLVSEALEVDILSAAQR